MKSKWKKLTTDNQKLENYFEATKLAITEIPMHRTKLNMAWAEYIAIQTLSDNKEIIIKPFDKGRGIAILNTQDYINECNRQLQDK